MDIEEPSLNGVGGDSALAHASFQINQMNDERALSTFMCVMWAAKKRAHTDDTYN